MLGIRQAYRRIEVLDGELVENANDLVLDPTQPRGAAPAMAVLEQQAFDFRPAGGKGRLELLGDRSAQLALASGIGRRKLRQFAGDLLGVEQGGSVSWGELEGLGHASSDSRGGAPCHGRCVRPRRGWRYGMRR